MGVSNPEMILSEDLKNSTFRLSSFRSKSSGDSKAKLKAEEVEVEVEDGDGFKTPTCLDKRIPKVVECPPAPKKPKSKPLMSIKRKLSFQQTRIVLHDLSNDIEAMFPPVLLADLGNKIKKVRQ